MLLVLDDALLFFDLTSDLGTGLCNLAATLVVGLLLSNLLVKLYTAFAFEIQTLDVLELLLLASVVLLGL